MGFTMKTRQSLVFLLLFCGCAHWQASRLQYGDFVTRGNGLVEVQADSTDAFYREPLRLAKASFSPALFSCRRPRANQWMSEDSSGIVKCTGPLDPTLVQKFSDKDMTSIFNYIKGQKPDRTYFEVMTKNRMAE